MPNRAPAPQDRVKLRKQAETERVAARDRALKEIEEEEQERRKAAEKGDGAYRCCRGGRQCARREAHACMLVTGCWSVALPLHAQARVWPGSFVMQRSMTQGAGI